MTINKNDVYKSFFEVVKSSLEWEESDTADYVRYIDGVTNMAQGIIDFIDKKENEKSE